MCLYSERRELCCLHSLILGTGRPLSCFSLFLYQYLTHSLPLSVFVFLSLILTLSFPLFTLCFWSDEIRIALCPKWGICERRNKTKKPGTYSPQSTSQSSTNTGGQFDRLPLLFFPFSDYLLMTRFPPVGLSLLSVLPTQPRLRNRRRIVHANGLSAGPRTRIRSVLLLRRRTLWWPNYSPGSVVSPYALIREPTRVGSVLPSFSSTFSSQRPVCATQVVLECRHLGAGARAATHDFVPDVVGPPALPVCPFSSLETQADRLQTHVSVPARLNRIPRPPR
ncbi:hypothetical protein LZ31DRAFT_148005 [Colletotrichum somersetense]|nr:hypothetical protein LZ31DRAFT_148005 [Colletotrichum somersetense]